MGVLGRGSVLIHEHEEKKEREKSFRKPREEK